MNLYRRQHFFICNEISPLFCHFWLYGLRLECSNSSWWNCKQIITLLLSGLAIITHVFTFILLYAALRKETGSFLKSLCQVDVCLYRIRRHWALLLMTEFVNILENDLYNNIYIIVTQSSHLVIPSRKAKLVDLKKKRDFTKINSWIVSGKNLYRAMNRDS